MTISDCFILDFILTKFKIKKLNKNEFMVKKNIIKAGNIQVVCDYEAIMIQDNYVYTFKYNEMRCECKINDHKGLINVLDLSSEWRVFFAKRTHRPEELIHQYYIANEEIKRDIMPQITEYHSNKNMISMLTNQIEYHNGIKKMKQEDNNSDNGSDDNETKENLPKDKKKPLNWSPRDWGME